MDLPILTMWLTNIFILLKSTSFIPKLEPNSLVIRATTSADNDTRDNETDDCQDLCYLSDAWCISDQRAKDHTFIEQNQNSISPNTRVPA